MSLIWPFLAVIGFGGCGLVYYDPVEGSGDEMDFTPVMVTSHSSDSLVTSFEQLFSGTCVAGTTVVTTPGDGVTILSTTCSEGRLEILCAFIATRGDTERRQFLVGDETNQIAVTFDFRRDCPDGFEGVATDADYSTGDFCAAKYEMKATDGLGNLGNLVNGGDGAIEYNPAYVGQARFDGTPWQGVTRQQAIDECAALGPGYALIDNDRWQTIARNVERTPHNWHATIASGGEDGIVGNGMLPRGHSDRAPAPSLAASADDSDGYANTDNSALADWETGVDSSGAEQLRTVLLSNGSVVWDFAGNNWEWVSTDVFGDQLTPDLSVGSWHDYTDATQFSPAGENHRLFAPKGPYDRLNGTGALYGGANGAIARGAEGSGDVHNSGVFSVGLNGAAGRAKAFRCVYLAQ